MVTGPSAWMSIAMSAPNRPVATDTPSSRSPSATAATTVAGLAGFEGVDAASAAVIRSVL